MKHFSIPKLPLFFRVLDYAMVPIMFVLGGFNRDSMQETHPWHSYRNFDVRTIDSRLTVAHTGTEVSRLKQHFVFLFHAPLFGGWKNYSVYMPAEARRPFFIGWVIYDTQSTKKLCEIGINKLSIYDASIRMLDGPPNYTGYFFAIDSSGKQIKLERTGSGRLGDNKYPGLRLF